MTHTPGAWRAEHSFAHFWIVDSDIGTVAHGCHEADAHLIAASPDMLAALEQAGPALETLMDEVTGKRATDWGKVNEAACAIHAAIKKARESAVKGAAS